jgi:hypothetical protein
MGAWGPGSFDNDDAADFLADLLDSGDTSLLRETLDNVLTSTEYVEAPDASQAIVAAEVVAAALGRASPAAARKAPLMAWLARIRPRIDATLALQCADALSRILAPNSELRELWEASDEFAEWRATLEELRSQVQSTQAPGFD